MIIEIKSKGRDGMSLAFTNSGKDMITMSVRKDGRQIVGFVLPMAELLKGIAEVNYHENSGNDQG